MRRQDTIPRCRCLTSRPRSIAGAALSHASPEREQCVKIFLLKDVHEIVRGKKSFRKRFHAVLIKSDEPKVNGSEIKNKKKICGKNF